MRYKDTLKLIDENKKLTAENKELKKKIKADEQEIIEKLNQIWGVLCARVKTAGVKVTTIDGDGSDNAKTGVFDSVKQAYQNMLNEDDSLERKEIIDELVHIASEMYLNKNMPSYFHEDWKKPLSFNEIYEVSSLANEQCRCWGAKIMRLVDKLKGFSYDT